MSGDDGAVRPALSHEEIWRRYDEIEVRLTAPVSERMLALADLQPGMRVLDLATGRGEPALRAARLVGPNGLVLGVDLSDGLLEMAREQAARDGLSNLDLRRMNAERLEGVPDEHFHVATARWGLMYMADPVSALARARRALVPEGVLVAAFWAEPERVPFYAAPRRPLQHLDLPDRDQPGMFRYADLEQIESDFERAGFSLDRVEEMDIPVFEAPTATEVVEYVRALGLTKLLNDLPEQDQRAWEESFRGEMERTRKGGVIQLGGITRIIRAVVSGELEQAGGSQVR